MTEGIAPATYTKLRACLRCKLIKSEDQWLKDGCENCEQLEIKNDSERMIDCTTSRFEGIISMINPAQSWVGRWNRLSNKIPGCYALDVQGVLPEDVPEEDEEKD
ncbi:unnamed protein product [Blepharisma stoltei]|uniref:Spt4/RpoE2 zinc finger domain-containing protein n=1 Tax=Blepharisma stoltei TaxID=1481888 RepID=A0AAU9K8F2_9CILI|nr:unnamed protein product [Blepharisma stoltei]